MWLSKHIWKLHDKNIQYLLKFKHLAKAQAFNSVTNICRPCLTEKYFLTFKSEGANINSKSEFYPACRHKAKVCPPDKKAKQSKR